MADHRDIYSSNPNEDAYRSSSGGGYWPIIVAIGIVLLIAAFFVFSGGGNGTAPPDINPSVPAQPSPTAPLTPVQ